MSKSNLLYLDHIVKSLSKIIEYLDGVDYSSFLENEEKQDAVIRKLEVVGEATKKIDRAVRERHSDIPWRSVAGMRDKLIHDYFDVDLEIVWKTAAEEIPTLLAKMQSVIKQLEQEE